MYPIVGGTSRKEQSSTPRQGTAALASTCTVPCLINIMWAQGYCGGLPWPRIACSKSSSLRKLASLDLWWLCCRACGGVAPQRVKAASLRHSNSPDMSNGSRSGSSSGRWKRSMRKLRERTRHMAPPTSGSCSAAHAPNQDTKPGRPRMDWRIMYHSRSQGGPAGFSSELSRPWCRA